MEAEEPSAVPRSGTSPAGPTRAQEAALIERAKEGDRRAFESLYRANVANITRLVRSMMGGGADASDVVQDVFIAAFRKIQMFRGESAFSTWLHRIAVNACMTRFRKQKRRRIFLGRYAAERQDPVVDESMTLREQAAPFYAAIDKLPAKKRAAFILFHIHGYSLEEIGALTESKVSTVSERIRSARKHLQSIAHKQAAAAVRVRHA